MNINIILSSKDRVRIIRHIIYKTDSISVSKTARDLIISKGMVSKYLKILLKEGIIKKEKNKLFINDYLQVKSLKILLNLEHFDNGIFKKYKFVLGAGLYGSLAKGTNNEESDIDLWVRIKETKQLELAGLTNELNKHYKNVRPLFLTNEKIEALKKDDSLFYHSLVFGSINLYGKELEV